MILIARTRCETKRSHMGAVVKSADLEPSAPKIEAGAAVLLRPVLQAVRASTKCWQTEVSTL